MSRQTSNMPRIQWGGREYRVWFESVTPEQAQKLLDSNKDRNRTLRAARVARYAADMRKDKWRITGETIRLDEKGLLLNGQHRLEAIVRSGVTVPMMFISGISAATMLVQDTGLAKTDGDWSTLSVQAIRVVKATMRVFASHLGNCVSPDEVADMYAIIGPAHVEWAVANSLSSGVTNRAPVKAAMAILHKVNPERAALFMSRLKAHAFEAKSPESALDSILTAKGAGYRHSYEMENALRAVVAATRDEGKPCGLLRGLPDKDKAWLEKAACLEKLRTLRRFVGDDSSELQSHGAAV